jgi:hypothetical protein
MTAPADDPILWATDTNWSSGPRSGDALKDTAMTAGVAAQGIVAGQTLKADQLNQLAWNHSQWLDYMVRQAGRAGDWSDGDVTLAAGTTTLTRHMYYRDLIVPVGATLDNDGYYIFARSITVAGTIDASGGDAEDGVTVGAPPPDPAGGVSSTGGPINGGTVGADGGYENTDTPGTAGGSVISSGFVALGGAGGAGGAASTQAGGAGGSAATPIWPIRTADFALNQIRAHVSGTVETTRYYGGTGGGSGGWRAISGLGAGTRGAGGGGGRILVIAAPLIEIDGGLVTAAGGAGGDAAGIAGTDGGGGGGGGGGGFAALICNRLINAGTFTAVGGAGGALHGIGLVGVAGSDGLALELRL